MRRTCVSAPELTAAAPGMALGRCLADVLELGARRDAEARLREVIAAHGTSLPTPGRWQRLASGMVVAVRPRRWLLLLPPAAAGRAAAQWQERTHGHAFTVELSAGLRAFFLSGTAVRKALARGCRLDLTDGHFPPGSAAATIIAQLAVTIAAVPRGLLLLTPASTARHFGEWLHSTAQPFGLSDAADVTVASVCGESPT
jgi:methylglutamate dehydrogenase subunit D